MFTHFEIGDAVRVIRNIRNDGTYPGKERGEMLISRGSVGYIKNIGTFLQDQIIYSVHFMDIDVVIGCREQELLAEADPWVLSQFEYQDKVTTNKVLTVKNNVIAKPNDVGEVLKVLFDKTTLNDSEINYHVRFFGHTLLVSESMLLLAEPDIN